MVQTCCEKDVHMKKLKEKPKNDETKEAQEEELRRAGHVYETDIFAYKHTHRYRHALALQSTCFTQKLPQTLLHTEVFSHRCFYTQKFLRTHSVAHSRFYTQGF